MGARETQTAILSKCIAARKCLYVEAKSIPFVDRVQTEYYIRNVLHAIGRPNNTEFSKTFLPPSSVFNLHSNPPRLERILRFPHPPLSRLLFLGVQ